MNQTTEAPPSFRTNLWLFLATIASVFVTYAYMVSRVPDGATGPGFFTRGPLIQSAQFTGTLLTILVAHELGHYIAARIHKVDASLPYFIPMPILSPFGTMGAVIRMRGIIPTRRALLDIGAAGPLAGLVFAIPFYVWGTMHSQVVAIPVDSDPMMLGDSILLKLLDRLAAPSVPEGMELALSPIGYGAWGGMFVTMINLLPVGQLDGGHVAFALFGPNQDRYARFVHRAMLAFFFVIIAGHLGRDLVNGFGFVRLGRHLSNGMFWLVWFQVLAILGAVASRGRPESSAPTLTIRHRILATVGLVVVGSMAHDHSSPLYVVAFFGGLAMLLAMEVKGGVLRPHDLLDHPPTSAAPLDGTRKAVAIITLVLFVLLFMPEPITM